MLDTNICIELIRGRGVNILRRLRQCAVGDVGISVITLAELAHGVKKSLRPEQNRVAVLSFCAPLEIRDFTDQSAFIYGKLRTDLERSGAVIGTMDLLIAAHALAEGATVVTNNEKEFRRVKGLSVENWI